MKMKWKNFKLVRHHYIIANYGMNLINKHNSQTIIPNKPYVFIFSSVKHLLFVIFLLFVLIFFYIFWQIKLSVRCTIVRAHTYICDYHTTGGWICMNHMNELTVNFTLFASDFLFVLENYTSFYKIRYETAWGQAIGQWKWKWKNLK